MSEDVLVRADLVLVGASDFEGNAPRLIADLADEVKRLRALSAVLGNRSRESTIRYQVSEFHRAFGQNIATKPHIPDEKTVRLRAALIAEECIEMLESVYGEEACADVAETMGHLLEHNRTNVDLVEFVDALADLDYVVEGGRLMFGVDGAPVAAEVHRSNMSKLGADGKPVIREDGKRLKGPNYSPPAIADELRKQGWEG